MSGALINLKSTTGEQQNSKWLRKTLIGVGLLVGIILASAYLLRDTLAAAVLTYLGQEQHVQVNCLEVDFDWQANVTLKSLCIELPNLILNAENALWLRSKNSISISKVQVQHRENPAASSTAAETSHETDFQLPQNLPTVQIETLTIRSPVLARELRLGLILDNAATLTISGDIVANLQQVEKNWHGEVEWTLADVLHTLPVAQTLRQQYADWLSDEVAKSAKFVSRIDFDGSQINANHDINFDNELAFPHCSLQLKLFGNINTRVMQPFLAKSLEIDLSAVHNTVDLTACEILPDGIVDWQLSQVSIHVPKPLYIDYQQLKMPEMQILGMSEYAQQQLVLNNINYEFTGAITAVFELNIEQALQTLDLNVGQVTLNSSGSISAVLPNEKAMTDLSWLLQDGQVRLGLQQISNSQLSLQQLVTDLKLSGSDDSGLQINGVVEADAFVGFDTTMAKLRSQVDLSIDSNQQLQIKLNNLIQKLSYQQLTLAQLDNQIDASTKLLGQLFGLDLNSLSQLNFISDSALTTLKSPDVTVAKLTNQLEVVGGNINDLQFKLTSQFDNNQLDGIKLTKLSNQLQGKLIERTEVEFNGHTNIDGLVINKADKALQLREINIDHQGHSALSLDSTNSEHIILLEKDFRANLTQQNLQLVLQIEQQNVTVLQPLIAQLSPDLTVTQGKLNVTANASLAPQKMQVNISLSDVSGRYSDYLFSGLNIQSPLSLNSAGLQLDKSTLNVNLLNVGLPIEEIKATLLSVNGALKLQNIAGNTLGGQFSVKDIWLDQREQQFDVVIENVDLAQVVALQDQPGISITGEIGGTLPVSSGSQTVSIDDGNVSTQGGGVLTINGNPAFDSIKKQQSELAFLENYHFSQLGSKVTLTKDGWLFLDLAFKGQNPDKKQAVNFNYSHQENLFTLLETLRITNSIQDKIEQSISKGGQQ